MKHLLPLTCSLIFYPAWLFAQGNLTPPGSPGPTMKTLAQIQPRTPVDATNTPSQSSSDDFTISQPGSYYLTGNIALAKPQGIHVTATNVTIDLCGFMISGTPPNIGIAFDGSAANAAVANGTITGFRYGINAAGVVGVSVREVEIDHCGTGGVESLLTGAGALVESCRLHDNTGFVALHVFNGSTVINCTLVKNTADYGIAAEAYSTVSHCTVSGGTNLNLGDSTAAAIWTGGNCNVLNCTTANNSNQYGIFVNAGSMISDCVASGNADGRAASGGILAGGAATVINCTAYANTSATTASSTTGMGIFAGTDCTLRSCTVRANQGDGINAGDRSLVIDCVSSGNGGSGTNAVGIRGGARMLVQRCNVNDNRADGINVAGDSVVSDNRSSHNGLGIAAAGINTTRGLASRIEGNQVRDNLFTGILASVADLVLRNTAGNQTTNYNPSSGVNFAPLQNLSTATNALGNMTF